MAASVDAWWFKSVLKIQFLIEDDQKILSSLRSTDRPVIICNHQSWFDVFLLQSLISTHGPILKFLIKAELLWVPVLGWVCLVLNFPRLKRSGDRATREQDLKIVQSASASLTETPGALLLFPEGTRFSEGKKIAQNSPYTFLLKPKPGGFNVIHEALTEPTTIIDVSISYVPGDQACWRCMSGLVSDIRIHLSSSLSDEVTDSVDWLNEIWKEKENWLKSKAL